MASHNHGDEPTNNLVNPLLTDFYQLTMAYGYWKLGMTERQAVFHLTFRGNPFDGGYTIAGLLGATIFLFLTGWFMCSLMLKAVSINRQAVIMFALGTVVIGVYSANLRVFSRCDRSPHRA